MQNLNLESPVSPNLHAIPWSHYVIPLVLSDVQWSQFHDPECGQTFSSFSWWKIRCQYFCWFRQNSVKKSTCGQDRGICIFHAIPPLFWGEDNSRWWWSSPRQLPVLQRSWPAPSLEAAWRSGKRRFPGFSPPCNVWRCTPAYQASQQYLKQQRIT